ncbi:MAG: sigma factor, partial [Sedimentisphaerales bacterium]
MMKERTWIELVSQARLGGQNAMSLLAQRAMERVRAYVYRVTLDSDLTEDLSQEVLLQMVKSLDDLHAAEHFWPWLYRIAQNKIKQHYKAKQRRISLSDTVFYRSFVARRNLDYQDDGLREATQKELSKKVMLAMKR